MKIDNTKIEWEQKTLKFNTLKYNFNAWALDIVRTICSDVEDFRKITFASKSTKFN